MIESYRSPRLFRIRGIEAPGESAECVLTRGEGPRQVFSTRPLPAADGGANSPRTPEARP
jgi:hypothetical protein